MSDLKPCPFCGEPGEMVRETPKPRAFVRCSGPKSCGQSETDWRGDEDAATLAWNRRPSLEPPASDVAGWRLVPMGPTEAMISAGSSIARRGGWIGDGRLIEVFKSMIAAAPPHPASKEVGDE